MTGNGAEHLVVKSLIQKNNNLAVKFWNINQLGINTNQLGICIPNLRKGQS